MQSAAKTTFSVLGLLLLSSAYEAMATSPAANQEPPPLVYTLRVQSETVDSWSLGLVAGLIGETYRKSHEKFLAAVRSATTGGGETESLIRYFACAGITVPTQPCRRIVEVQETFTQEKLRGLLEVEPTRSVRVAEIAIIFDGRFFQVPTKLYEVRLNDTGELVRSHDIGATYITTYSRSLHQEDINSHRNDSAFSGKIGSKEGRMHFWLGGANPRLIVELNRSFKLLAELWTATTDQDATGILAGDQSGRASLPRVRDVVSSDSSQCKTLHGNYLVAKDLGEILWLVFPSNAKNLQNTFFIEPRCGFDY